MPKPYSVDLRARVIEDVESGASRREAAERYGISPSAAAVCVKSRRKRSPWASSSSVERPMYCRLTTWTEGSVPLIDGQIDPRETEGEKAERSAMAGREALKIIREPW